MNGMFIAQICWNDEVIEITVRKQVVNEEQLREEIEDALETRADRETERLRIEVHDAEVDIVICTQL